MEGFEVGKPPTAESVILIYNRRFRSTAVNE